MSDDATDGGMGRLAPRSGREMDASPNLERRSMNAVAERAAPTRVGGPADRAELVSVPSVLETAWCGVGGDRGGEIVPRWFGNLADIGVEHVSLFWAMPEEGQSDAALERLRSVSTRWLAEIRAMGMEGSLSIKRGDPGPWLTSLSELSGGSLIVVGPPATRGGRSTTVQHLLRYTERPLLLLPDLLQPPIVTLWSRVIVDAAPAPHGPRFDWPAEAVERVDLDNLDPVRAVRTAVRLAEDLDATLLCFPRRAAALVPLALEYGNFPVLVTPGSAPGQDVFD
jgi:hypothetical protein